MYYLLIIMQIYCIYHIVTQKNDLWWIPLVIFLPLFGCLFYIYKKIINQPKIAQQYSSSNKPDLASIFNPGGKIKELEKQVAFSNTFTNKVALGDAYLQEKMYDEAIPVFESTRAGIHDNDPHVNNQLIYAYFHKNNFESVIEIAKKASQNPSFNKANAKVLYGLALESTGELDKADSVLQSMNRQYVNLEPRIIYAKFLIRQNREADAKNIYTEIIAEAEHMSNFELKDKRQWFDEARDELKRM